ncbi:hypothetical protein [Streptomyces sp. NPDC049887]|uniref:hypothetical protein n=1 Tax=Streptomyces sp. NPDC049887 TaxID=3155654 RepID=UPI00341F2507
MSDSTYDDVLIRRSLSPVARTDGTDNGAGVDLGANGGTMTASVCVVTGTITDGSHVISVEESADDSSYAAVAASNIQGTAPTLDSDDSDTQYEFGVRTNLRYVRVVAVTSSATTGGVFAAVVALGKCRQKPVSHA